MPNSPTNVVEDLDTLLEEVRRGTTQAPTEDELRKARERIGELERIVARCTAPPWLSALYLGCANAPVGHHVIWQAGQERLVAVHPQFDSMLLTAGQTVYLNSERNLIVALDGELSVPRGQAICTFERRIPGGRLVGLEPATALAGLVKATPPPINHIRTTDECDACHRETS